MMRLAPDLHPPLRPSSLPPTSPSSLFVGGRSEEKPAEMASPVLHRLASRRRLNRLRREPRSLGYQRVSPDYIPLPNGAGRKPSYVSSPPAFDAAKPLRPRSASGSGSDHQHHHHSPPDSLHPDTAAAAAAAASPAHRTPGGHHEINGVGGDVLLQWGHNKRSRGSRAERAASSAAAGDESPAHARQAIRIQRRAVAERLAAAAMPPPPCGSYTRGANLRPCTPVRDSPGPHLRSAEERSGGASRPEKRAPASPGHKMNGCDASDSKQPSDQETAGSGGAAAAEKLNLEQFEWPRIYISLSRKEKEDDFLAMKGTKLPQRPKKRAKNIDKTLQYCFPGMWLSDLTRGRYEVREKKCVKKKRRGLKGMECMDSDSE